LQPQQHHRAREPGEFRSYLSAVGFSTVAFSMQQLLVSWLLVGVLLLPADSVGLLQAAIGLPGFVLMLAGGAAADRHDPRDLLVRVYLLTPVFPLLLLGIYRLSGLSAWSVLLWGLGMSSVIAFSTPAQHALLNRVAGQAVQQGVTAATAIGFLVQTIGLFIAGQMERIGLPAVLLVQGLAILLAGLLMRRIQRKSAGDDPGAGVTSPVRSSSSLRRVREGIQATVRNRVVFHVLLLNVFSSVFNAGAFLTVFPFIIKRIYDGDAQTLALTMVAFYVGAMTSNFLMLRFMPFQYPGRWYLLMQLSRIPILVVLWIRPGWYLLVAAIVAWGLNMGVTSTLARAIVQESSQVEYRARILSVYSLGLLGAPPIGALVLGALIEWFGTLNALIPGMLASMLLCLVGLFATDLWRYRSRVPEILERN
jgi:predicted MFS family arabinose efflux permease